ncbi:MAG: hypothetical protein GX811_01630, partial [Lentisphaerae bacterium]|nr:hypothetical protein [Lentisphaerota bacterium]
MLKKTCIVFGVAGFFVCMVFANSTYEGKLLILPNREVVWSGGQGDGVLKLDPNEDAKLTFEPSKVNKYIFEDMDVNFYQAPYFCWTFVSNAPNHGRTYRICNSQYMAATATVHATCYWIPIGGGGSGYGTTRRLEGYGKSIAKAESLLYWTLAQTNILKVGESTTVKAYINDKVPANSTWTCSPNMTVSPRNGGVVEVSGRNASAYVDDSHVEASSRDFSGRQAKEFFTVVGVESIEADPAIVAIGDTNINYTITTSPSNFVHMVDYTPANTGTQGVHKVVATCGSSSASCDVTVVAVESIEANPSVVPLGATNVNYTVKTSPSSFEYMVSYEPADTSIAGEHEVIATCGTSSASCIVEVVDEEILVDLDIDSDHSNGDFGGPARSDFEEEIEGISPGPVPHQAHKYVLVNTYHSAHGYTPGYADFSPITNSQPGEIRFTPVVLSVLSPGLQTNSINTNIHVWIRYSASDPLEVASGASGAWERPGGELRIWTKDINEFRNPSSVLLGGDYVPPDVKIPFDVFGLEAGSKTLYLEGINPAQSLGSTSIEAFIEYTESGVQKTSSDKVHCTPIEVNVDLDNFNDSGYGTSVHETESEDHYEDYIDGTNHVGRIMVVNDSDIDVDGIPDFADGYSLFDTDDMHVSSGVQFVPIIFEVPAPIDINRANVRLTYSASDPLGVTSNSTDGFVLPEEGHLRIWIKDGSEERNGKSLKDGGDFLKEGEYTA